MKRRSLILGASTIALSQLASGCTGQQASLKVRLLQNSIPVQLLGEFRKTLKSRATLNFDPEKQLSALFKLLTTLKEQDKPNNNQDWFPLDLIRIRSRTPISPDLVTLGDYWLKSAIEQELIQPLKIETLPGWEKLPPEYQKLVKRHQKTGLLDNSGKVWGAPYRWGATVIAYRRDKFKALGWTPTDWSDLWRESLRDRISVLDHPREVIGLTLKNLGLSYNQQDLNQVKDLKPALRQLAKQVKFYSSDHYLKPLVLGDTWVAVGWSTDILALRTRDRQIEAVIPQSGTALWSDVWVKPVSVSSASDSSESNSGSDLTKEWIQFCWQSKSAKQISLLTNAASPILVNMSRNTLPQDIQSNHLLLPEAEILNKCEFLHPLPESTQQQYQSLWKEMRST
ncbi:extracellular solute-binding protein [Moorena producens JHB]|uniref:Extracellular solute-binding protein n=1 Tax=Moorena producens (strain JHB) TaxID=1454205 RepID=A0A1D9G7J6_MOOP1|nr:extracellular solute-binding protein [Moorena producens]AOY83617.1 extracellular solute-binding protein [Moorena producens JHB]